LSETDDLARLLSEHLAERSWLGTPEEAAVQMQQDIARQYGVTEDDVEIKIDGGHMTISVRMQPEPVITITVEAEPQ
jgi:hypothetical protein